MQVNEGMAPVQEQGVAASNEPTPMQPQNGAMGVMNNKIPTQMRLDRFHNWSGIPSVGYFPPTIPTNGTVLFTHLKSGQFGSVGGVQYSGLNAWGISCAWVLAWIAPANNTPPLPPNRVYAICGVKRQIDDMSWDQILQNLEIAMTDASFVDEPSKTNVHAHIHDLNPNTASLSATFGLY